MAELFPLEAGPAGVVVVVPVTLNGVTPIFRSTKSSTPVKVSTSPKVSQSQSQIILDLRPTMVLVPHDPSSLPDQSPVVKPITHIRKKAVLSKAVATHTVVHVTQIWADRLRLISICASFFTTIDSLLLKLASGKKDGSLARNVVLSSLAGSLIFHGAAASVAYVGSLLLIRHRLNEAQAAPETPISRTAVITDDDGSENPRISEPTVITSTQAPSTLESGHVRFSEENIEHSATSNVHPTSVPSTRIFSTTPTGARSSLVSAITEHVDAHLHHPAGLDMGMRRVSLFNLSAVVPCVGTPGGDADDDQNADVQENAVALGRLLNNCHGVCSCFMLVGFTLVVIGVVACLWEVFELSIAIFGSACIALCLVLGFGALR